MSEVRQARRIWRSVGAVFAGAVFAIIFSVGTDEALRLTGMYPALGEPMASPLLLLATVYRTVYGIVGAMLTAWISPYRPITHVLVLGAMGLAANVLGTVATWNKGPAFGPHWYPVTLIVLAVPTAWAGGWLYLALRGESQ
jgi:hypothetical protein